MKKPVFKNIIKMWVWALGIVIVLQGCIKAGGSQPGVKKHGWKTPITTENWPVDPAKLHLEGAPHGIIGLSLEQIVTDSNIQVRPDGASCMDCHDWAEEMTAESFCRRIDDFITTDQDGEGPKPEVLKDIFIDWKNRNCPD
ncbi:MAG: hypothetical protein PVH36_08445 [Desulfobacterales bacterium]|jgi:hypothetical protein